MWLTRSEKPICLSSLPTVLALTSIPSLCSSSAIFSEISKNWAGRPLDSYETVLNYLRSTTTSSGLSIKAYLAPKDYANGEQISHQCMAELTLKPHKTQPSHNYTLHPR